MKINVTENKVSIKEEQILNENEYNIHKIQFDFSSEYTNDLVKVALFSIDNHTYKKIISNNECDIPPEVLTKRGYSILGVYAYKTEQDTLVLRYSPSPTRISVYDGSYKAEAENSEPITPSEIEQYQQILQNSLQQFQNQYNVLVEETEGDIQAIEDELQRKVDEGYFDGEDGYTPQKGTDYFTQEDIDEIENGVKTDLEETVLVDYSLITETGSKIELSINTTNYKLTAILKDKNNATICTSNEIDLPLETMVVSASYDNTTKEIILTLQNGNTVRFSVADLVSGLVSEAQLQTILANYYTKTEENALLGNKVDKVQGKGLSTEDYTTAEKIKLSGIEAEANKTIVDDELDNESENPVQNKVINTEIEKLQTEDTRLKATLPTTTGTGQTVTLNKTAEMEFIKPPLPRGNTKQETTIGYNLLGGFEYEQSSGGVTFKYDDSGTIAINGTSTFNTDSLNSSRAVANGFTRRLETGTYTLNGISTGTGLLLAIATNESGVWSVKTTTLNEVKSFTIENDCDYFFRAQVNSGVTYSTVLYPILVKGSYTSETMPEYEPYTNGPSPNPDYPQEIINITGDVEVLVQNGNLFNINDFTQKASSEFNVTEQNGEVTLSRASDTTYRYELNCKENTAYTLQLKVKNPANNYYMQIRYDDNTSTDIYSQNATSDYVNVTKTSDSNKTIKYFEIQLYGWDNQLSLKDIQLEEGSTATSYIPHQEQKFTFPLGNEKLMLGDYLADDGIHHVRGKMTFNGTETYLKRVNDEINAYYYTLGNVYKVRANEINYTSNYFSPRKQTDSATLYNENKTFNLDTTPPYYVRFRFNEINTVEDFKSWVSQHNIILEYELKEEVIVPYTTAQQTVYNAIKQAISYEGQTNISSNQNAIFNVEAYLDTKVILSEKGTYSKPSTGIPKTDLSNAVQTSLNKADTALQSHQDISGKQDITDNTLTTINKTVPTAINEVNSIAKGANQALSYSNYQAMITAFNALANNVYNVGQNVMIVTLQVPDLWISGIESTSVPYTYTTDEAFTTALATNGYVQVGYYKLSALETQKVDLTDYVTNTDYATSNKGGVFKTQSNYGVDINNGFLRGLEKTYANYSSADNTMFVSKGTLENVITGKSLETANNKVTSISNASTNTQYPSAKAVYDYIQSLDGDEVSY